MSSNLDSEGVIKFKVDFREGPLRNYNIEMLNKWRKRFHYVRLIGCSPGDGIGYGNISQKISPPGTPKNKRSFIITGSQTGGIKTLTDEHYCIVMEYDHRNNHVKAEGLIKPSAESMTHGQIYDLDDRIGFVFHPHSPVIWNAAKHLGIPITNKDVEYGTPEMAKEVERLFAETNVREMGIFAMGGHKDGIVSFGRTPEEAGFVAVYYFAKAKLLGSSLQLN